MAVNPITSFNLNQIGKVNSIGNNRSNDFQNTDVNGVGFSDFLKDAISKVNDLQLQAEEINQKFVTGEIQDIHSVMIASEKAELSLQFTLAVRNKILDAYNEIMRMPI